MNDVDEKLWSTARAHTDESGHRTILIEKEGWLCEDCDADFGEMVNWAESVGRTIHNDAGYCCQCGSFIEWDEMECYLCDSANPPLRRLVGEGPVVEAHRDPTSSYKLACGHTII
jgi:hypothetical protein